MGIMELLEELRKAIETLEAIGRFAKIILRFQQKVFKKTGPHSVLLVELLKIIRGSGGPAASIGNGIHVVLMGIVLGLSFYSTAHSHTQEDHDNYNKEDGEGCSGENKD